MADLPRLPDAAFIAQHLLWYRRLPDGLPDPLPLLSASWNDTTELDRTLGALQPLRDGVQAWAMWSIAYGFVTSEDAPPLGIERPRRFDSQFGPNGWVSRVDESMRASMVRWRKSMEGEPVLMRALRDAARLDELRFGKSYRSFREIEELDGLAGINQASLQSLGGTAMNSGVIVTPLVHARAVLGGDLSVEEIADAVARSHRLVTSLTQLIVPAARAATRVLRRPHPDAGLPFDPRSEAARSLAIHPTQLVRKTSPALHIDLRERVVSFLTDEFSERSRVGYAPIATGMRKRVLEDRAQHREHRGCRADVALSRAPGEPAITAVRAIQLRLIDAFVASGEWGRPETRLGWLNRWSVPHGEAAYDQVLARSVSADAAMASRSRTPIAPDANACPVRHDRGL